MSGFDMISTLTTEVKPGRRRPDPMPVWRCCLVPSLIWLERWGRPSVLALVIVTLTHSIPIHQPKGNFDVARLAAPILALRLPPRSIVCHKPLGQMELGGLVRG